LQHSNNKVFLHPGEFCFSEKQSHIHTLLGSCISITLWHPKLLIGGMCHFTLPKHPGAKRPTAKEMDGRYADDVIEMFRQETAKHGTKLTEYQAKIFGGGNMMKSKGQNTEDSIGTKNATAAMMLLMNENVDILVAHVGEFGHRRIVFDTNSGNVWVRHVDNDGTRRESINGKV